MFPAIKDAWRDFRSGFGTQPEPLALKEMGLSFGLTFDSINADWYGRNGFHSIYAALSGGMPAWSGEAVSVATALNHSVVWACRKIISESVAFLPLAMMQATAKGKYPATDKPGFSLLHNAPNDEMTAMTFREVQTGHCLLQGNAYSQIIRRSGTGVAMELQPLLPTQVRIERDQQKRLNYLVKDGNSPEKTFVVERGKPHDILHIKGIGDDGISGYPVVTFARQSIGTALATERYTGTFFKMGARTPYLLERNQKFKNDQEFDKWRADWERVYSDYHRAPILEGGGTNYKQIGLSARDAQFIEMRLFTIHEICRWFSISPHLVGDLSRATFSNIEQLAMEFVKMTLTVWLIRWEQELWRCLLTPEEKSQGYFFKHNVDALLRGDFLTRMQGYSTMLQNGIASPNEVRDLEDWNPYEGGDERHIQLNMQYVPQNGLVSLPTASRTTAADSVSEDPEG